MPLSSCLPVLHSLVSQSGRGVKGIAQDITQQLQEAERQRAGDTYQYRNAVICHDGCGVGLSRGW